MILHRSLILGLSVGLSLFLFGCAKPLETPTSQGPANRSELSQWIGKTVQVQFRRDALGAGADLPVSPTTDSINGAETSIGGTLTAVEPHAIVLNANDGPKWIPREVILLVESTP